ncbi:Putative F0F1-ATPase subunit Ca2+/Mg2+ transporter [Marininema mesophilum]|uniref:Putative F0F1-ATPase subunit Ca2+/Mg2+ transporter n=1 Tax=Marininema mesophilum TaxID=1048340 RepID=A0A1H2TB97_9BACL|nr:AtpZ/AtpI family protein [Marininema mesophilum]SDW41138.1 Putative F0F1-ATPase subunit Ca2+/Mg2+ transporter [Marininema mesophilum]
MKKNGDDPWKMVAVLGALGIEVVILTLAGAWVGKTLDAHFDSKPIFMAVGVLGGLVISFVGAALTIRSFLK